MVSSIDIRPALKTDLPRIAEILIGVGLCKSEGLERRLLVFLERAADTCFVSTRGDRITGVALAAFNGFHLFLAHLAVEETDQSSGIGRALHARIVDRAEELDANGIITDSWLTSTGFFYRLGYRLPGAIFLIRDL